MLFTPLGPKQNHIFCRALENGFLFPCSLSAPPRVLALLAKAWWKTRPRFSLLHTRFFTLSAELVGRKRSRVHLKSAETRGSQTEFPFRFLCYLCFFCSSLCVSVRLCSRSINKFPPRSIKCIRYNSYYYSLFSKYFHVLKDRCS